MHGRVPRVVTGLGIGLAAWVTAWALGLLPFMRTIELKTYDLRVRSLTDARQASAEIVLVSITDASVRKLEPLVGRWPWPRLIHAQLIDYLARAPARVVGYDVLFAERDRRTFDVDGDTWTGAESDRVFAEAVARAGNVVVVADVSVSDPLASSDSAPSATALRASAVTPDAAFEARPGLVMPYGDLAEAAIAVGHNLMVLDPDGPVRRTVPAVRVGQLALPSLALATALRAMHTDPSAVVAGNGVLAAGRARVPLVRADIPGTDGSTLPAWRQLIRFTGPAAISGATPAYTEYSFFDLYYSEEQIRAGERPYVSPEAFRDKIVLVGTTAAGLHDLFTVPFAGGKMPGAQVHANVVDNLLSGRFMQPAPWWADLALCLAWSLLVAAIVLVSGVWWGTAAALAVMAAVGGVSAALFVSGVWVEVARPAAAVALGLFGGTAYQYFVEGREKRLVKHVFSRFVSHDVYEQLMKDPSRARLGGGRRDMSVLFADIRGFTTLTERGRPDDVVRQLNEYFSAMVPVVFAHRGTVDKFVGDMIMALFGAPLDDPDHPEHAVQAGLAMLAELDALNARLGAAGLPALDIGIGISTGDMVAGNIGASSIMSYTAIGDAVNLGARLESLNKDFGTRLLVSEATRARLKERYDVRALGTVTVKGKTRPVEIFEIRPAVCAEPLKADRQ